MSKKNRKRKRVRDDHVANGTFKPRLASPKTTLQQAAGEAKVANQVFAKRGVL